MSETIPKVLLQESLSFVESLKRLQDIYYSILTAIPHALIGIKERNIFFANESVERVFGWKPEELIGKSTRILYRSEEDYKEIGKRFYPILEKKKTHIEDFPCIRKDGKEIICRVSASVIGEKMVDKGIVVMYEDITDYKRLESVLIESEKKYREIIQNVNSIILKWNNKGEITFINEFGKKYFGYSEDELIGKNVVGTIVPEVESTGRDLQEMMKRIIENPQAFEKNINENITKDGRRVWISWANKAILDEKGEIIEVFSVGTDITDRLKIEEELKFYKTHLEELVKKRTEQLEVLNKELQNANEKLKELDRLKSMFIATMSHELRTPLNSIIGFTGMTLKGLSGPLNEEQRDNLTRSYNSAKHLLGLITDIIDISKIESGKIDIFIEEFKLRDVIDEAVETIKPMIIEKNLSLHKNLYSEIKVKTERKRLLQCLINLLSNAVKYTEKGEIRFSVKDRNREVEISVSDTGIGIDEKDIPRLFEPFERIGTHLSVKAGGTGLGLYLTKKLIKDVLKGDIEVESQRGKGSTFTIRIPKDLEKERFVNK